MDKLLAILQDIDPDIDYENVTDLIDGKVLNSFSIISLISQIEEEYDITIRPKYLIPENFNSVAAMRALIQLIEDEE